jgi:general secretion pathway protein E
MFNSRSGSIIHLAQSEAQADRVPDAEAFASELGARLVEAGLIDHMALRRAERARRHAGERLEVALVRLGLVSEGVIAREMSTMLGIPLATAVDFPPAAVLADRIEKGFLVSRRIVPLSDAPDRLVVAVADPFDRTAIADLEFALEKPLEVMLATTGDIDDALMRLFGSSEASRLATETVNESAAPSDEDVRHLADLASEAPVIKLVQDLIVRAVEARASDIHVEQRADSLCVRFRVDGILHTLERLPPELAPGVISRIKILARLDIAERRLPQDGRTRSVVRGRDFDIRVSTVPTMNGESCVLRLLDPASLRLEFPELGFEPRLLADLQGVLRRPHGIVLVTGPTGSGKTTTLYSALALLDSETRKILTAEDPVEYRLAGMSQIQVQPRIGLSFASALRSILRQDPDVIMIGEIRDLETAQIAIQASLTGHLVLSTLHTNNAAASVTRLLDVGVESYLLASSVSGILAQRLVRRLCEACAVPEEMPADFIARLVEEGGAALPAEIRRAPRLMARRGCAQCRDTGYKGRLAIGELLVVDHRLRAIVHNRASEREIEEAAVMGGMTTLYQAGLSRALAGQTTLEEILRVTRIS